MKRCLDDPSFTVPDPQLEPEPDDAQERREAYEDMRTEALIDMARNRADGIYDDE